jgi:hypothetical protein
MIKRSIKLLAFYAGGAWSLIEILSFATEKYDWPHAVLDFVIRLSFNTV